MYNVIDVVFTKVFLEDIEYKQKYRFMCDYPVEIGDILEDDFHKTPVQVINKDVVDTPYMGSIQLKDYIPTKINGKEVGNIYKPNKNNKMETAKKVSGKSMFNGLMDKITSQYMPVVEEDVKMSLEGTICVPVQGEYVSITEYKDDKGVTQYRLTKYDPSMTMDIIPVYSVEKTIDKIIPGDIVKNGRSYARVIGKTAEGFKVLSFTGTKSTKIAATDFLLGQPTMRTLVNFFNFDSNGFNPLLYAVMKGDTFDMQSLMLLSATPQGKKLFSNMGGGFNPMLLAMMDKNKEGDSNSMLEGMMMMSMMGGGQNPFQNMFNGFQQPQPAPQPSVTPAEEATPNPVPVTPTANPLEETNKKIDSLTNSIAQLCSIFTQNVNKGQVEHPTEQTSDNQPND